MTNNMLIYCRYYQGESQNPYHDKERSMVWESEKFWAQAGENNNIPLLREYLQDYMHAGLGIFEVEDSTPITLKALLFCRYCQQKGYTYPEGVEPFKAFYGKYMT